MKTFALIIFFICCSLMGLAQTGTVSGTVTDSETGEPLPFCNVFISNSTIATTTDFDGNYTLENVPEGEFEVGFSFIGYQAQQKSATIHPGGKLTFNISLVPLVQDLTDVEIKASRDRAWERELRKFKLYFLGNDDMAAQCEILNPWAIDFPEDNKNNDFRATAYQPIEIENRALGYLVTFDLKAFQFTPSFYIISGATRFTDLEAPDEKTKAEWERRRLDTYLKSPANMFRAMIVNQHNKEGFFLYGDKVGGSESRNLRSDVFANELGKSVIPYKPENLIQPGRRPGEYRIFMKGRIEIHYEKGYSTVNTYKDAPYPISWLEVKGNYVQVNSNGMIINQKDVVFSGDMDKRKISSLLPLDYEPNLADRGNAQLAQDAHSMQERVYLHTDRSFYYTGDQVLFKAYLNYAGPEMKRALSNILYVELVSADRDIVIQKKFKIENGQAIGDLNLPDSLSQKNYYLRAYTQWNRNYGPDAYYIQPLPVISPFDRISSGPESSANKDSGMQISFTPSKNNLGKREKVAVQVELKDQTGRPLASNLSIAVRDGHFSPDLVGKTAIQEVLEIKEIPSNITTEKFTYGLERSWNVTGRFLSEKGKPTASPFTVYFNNFEGMLELESDKEGMFTLEEMEFYGPMEFAFIATDKRGKAFGDFELVEKLNPPFYVPDHIRLPTISEVNEPIFIGYEREERLIALDQVTVEKEREDGTTRTIYGRADHVVPGDKLNRNGSITDLLMSLRAQVPGMSMNTNLEIRIRGGGTSANLSMEPLVMINGAVMPSNPGVRAADNIAAINPNDIDRIEVVSRTSSMMGDLGRNGIIAVYTKQGFSQSSLLSGTPGLVSIIIDGFGSPSNFVPFDYENTDEELEMDQRVTLYWNPYVVTDAEKGEFSFEFFSNDSEGPKIIEVEGLSIDGQPIRATYLLPSSR